MIQYTNINDELPEKGKDVKVILTDGTETTTYRCACKNEKCTEWKCPITGSGLIIDVIKWKYF